jgi:hypothetical protein
MSYYRRRNKVTYGKPFRGRNGLWYKIKYVNGRKVATVRSYKKKRYY